MTISARVSRGCRAAFPLAVAVVLVASVLDPGISPAAALNDKLQHLAAFALLALLAGLGNPRWPLYARVAPGLILYGLLIEAIQWWLPWREFAWLDWLADAAGVLGGALAVQCMPAAPAPAKPAPT